MAKFVTCACLFLVATPGVMYSDGAPTANASQRLHALFEREWEYGLKIDPVNASWLGDRRYNDQWPDVSLEALERRHQHNLEVLEELKQFDVSELSAQDQINYRLFRKEYENAVEGYQFRWHLLPINQMEGVQTLDDLADALRFETVKDYTDWTVRLQTFPAYMEQTIALMKEGPPSLPRVIRVALAACPPVSAARRSRRVSRSVEQVRRDIGLPASNAIKQVRPPSYLDSSSLEAPTE